jgi:hypothetical protein
MTTPYLLYNQVYKIKLYNLAWSLFLGQNKFEKFDVEEEDDF